MTHAQAPETAGKTLHWARYYDAATWLFTFGQAGAIRKKTVALAEVKPGEKALDVGCGTGSLAIAMRKKMGPAGEVHGIDAAPEMVQVAKAKAAKQGVDARFQVGLIERLPFEDGYFGLVTSTLMLHHLPGDLKRQGLAEIRRVLRPGGRLLVVDIRSDAPTVVGRILRLFGHGEHIATGQELKEALSAAGFEQLKAVHTRFREMAFLEGRRKEEEGWGLNAAL